MASTHSTSTRPASTLTHPDGRVTLPVPYMCHGLFMLPTGSGTKMTYVCSVCKGTVDADRNQHVISSEFRAGDSSGIGQHGAYIGFAAHDDCAKKDTSIPCPLCKLPYMTLLLLGHDLKAHRVCECGAIVTK